MPDTAASLQTTVDIPYLAAIAVRRGGGQYVGIQRGLGTADVPDLVLFNDPQTGSTLALAISQVSPWRVRAKIQDSRFRFAAVGR